MIKTNFLTRTIIFRQNGIEKWAIGTAMQTMTFRSLEFNENSLKN